MTLLITESFEFTNTGDKWNVSGGGNTTGNAARTGTHTGTAAARQLTAAEEHATMIVGLAHASSTGWSTNGNPTLMSFSSDNGATLHIYLVAHGSNNAGGQLDVFRGDGTLLGTTAASPILLSNNTYQYVEVKVVLGASGSVVVKIDDTLVLSLTGVNTKNGGTKTVIDRVALAALQRTTSSNGYIDDVYICNGAGSVNNDFLGPVHIEALKPNGNGASSGMTNDAGNSTNNYSHVDDNLDFADYVDGATAGVKDTYAFENSTLPTANTVKGVMVYAYALKTDAGARGLQTVARSGGSETTATPIVALANGVAHLLWGAHETNPSGGSWLVSDVNAAEFGVVTT
jgi:hypothetical protein